MPYDKKIDVDFIDPILSRIAVDLRKKTNTYSGMNYDEMAEKISKLEIAYQAPYWIYECTSVDTANKTWTGIGWKRDNWCLYKYSYETTGLTYKDTPPIVGTTYTRDGQLAVDILCKCVDYGEGEYVDPWDADVLSITGGFSDDQGNVTDAIVSIDVVGSPNIAGLEYTTDINSIKWRQWKPEYKFRLREYSTIYFRNTNSTLSTSSSDYITFKFEGDVSVSGKASGLLNGSTACTPYCFYRLFAGCHMSLSTSFLSSITATADYCYAHMFDGATGFSGGMSGTIDLPALDVAPYAYSYMFANSDVQGVSMPHQKGTLHQYACSHMFDSSNCASCVITASVIEDYACEYICYNCQNINNGGAYTSNASIGTYAFQYAFANSTCVSDYSTSSTVALSPYAFYYAYANSRVTAARINVMGAPIGCFEGTWSGCSNLTDVYCHLLDYGNATTNWLAGVSKTGRFRRYGNGEYDPETYVEKLLPVKWGASYIPDDWVVEPAPQMLSPYYITQKYDGTIDYTVSCRTEDASAEFKWRLSYTDVENASVSEDGRITGSKTGDGYVYVIATDIKHGHEYYISITFIYEAPKTN